MVSMSMWFMLIALKPRSAVCFFFRLFFKANCF
jgi:hypothetical protein